MAQGSINLSVSIGGVTVNQTIVLSADNAQVYEIALPAGYAGAVSTKTDANTGVVTLAAGHGVQSDAIVDVFWDGGVRYGMTATVAGNDVTVDGGAGDDLPAAATSVIVTPQVTFNAPIDGDAVQIVTASCTQRSHVDFQDAGQATIKALPLAANQQWPWWYGSGGTNPLTGNVITTGKASNGSSSTAATLTVLVLQDATP
jgi:hypothetical protein